MKEKNMGAGVEHARESFNKQIPVDKKQHTVNYVWINAEDFEVGDAPDDPQCGVPLHYVDMVISNAKVYSDTDFQIWVDAKLVENSSTVSILQNHLDSSGCENIKIKDLNKEIDKDIINYKESPYFFSGLRIPVWHRVDLARFLVIQQSLKECPEKVAVYSDFDVKDIGIHRDKFKTLMDQHGFVLGSTTEEAKRNWPENGYFSFSKSGDADSLLSKIVDSIYETTSEGVKLERNDVFNAYLESVENFFESKDMKLNSRNLFHVLEPPLYKIPRNPKYDGLSI